MASVRYVEEDSLDGVVVAVGVDAVAIAITVNSVG